MAPPPQGGAQAHPSMGAGEASWEQQPCLAELLELSRVQTVALAGLQRENELLRRAEQAQARRLDDTLAALHAGQRPACQPAASPVLSPDAVEALQNGEASAEPAQALDAVLAMQTGPPSPSPVQTPDAAANMLSNIQRHTGWPTANCMLIPEAMQTGHRSTSPAQTANAREGTHSGQHIASRPAAAPEQVCREFWGGDSAPRPDGSPCQAQPSTISEAVRVSQCLDGPAQMVDANEAGWSDPCRASMPAAGPSHSNKAMKGMQAGQQPLNQPVADEMRGSDAMHASQQFLHHLTHQMRSTFQSAHCCQMLSRFLLGSVRLSKLSCSSRLSMFQAVCNTIRCQVWPRICRHSVLATCSLPLTIEIMSSCQALCMVFSNPHQGLHAWSPYPCLKLLLIIWSEQHEASHGVAFANSCSSNSLQPSQNLRNCFVSLSLRKPMPTHRFSQLRSRRWTAMHQGLPGGHNE